MGADVIIIDTAGRLHNKVNLMNELSKIKRVMQKMIPDAPHEVLLVVDATTGRRLFIFGTPAPIYAAPVIANGALYAPSTDGFLYVYEVPPELIPPTATPTAVATATSAWSTYF